MLASSIRDIDKNYLLVYLFLVIFWQGPQAIAADEIIRLEGLKAPVSLRIDNYGITHVSAENTNDLYFAQGYNAARDRLWQMDMWLRSGRGELAAILGEQYVAHDRAARLMLYRGDMSAEWAAYGPGVKASVTSFVTGINAYINWLDKNRSQQPPEFDDLGYRPATWLPEDIVRIRSHGVWQNLISEIERSFMFCYGLSEQDSLRVKLEPSHVPVVPEGLDTCAVPEQVLNDYLLATYPSSFGARQGGSNSWAISGNRTLTGRPILAADPHLAYTVPSTRYAVHLSAPGIDVIGAGEPHIPGVSIGHNGNVAFSVTTFPVDQEDLIVYEVNPQDSSSYRYAKGWEEFKVLQESIAVKDKGSVEVTLKFTRHGPVLYEGKGQAYALRSVAFEYGSAPYLGQISLISAANVDAYDKALQHWGAPGEQHVFADTDGQIAWRSAAKAPIRKNYDGLLPVPGDGRYEWQGFHTLDSLPRGENPAQGWIATANNILAADSYPYEERGLSYEWAADWRARRIAEILESTPKHTIADSLALQTDYTSVFAREMQAVLRGFEPEQGKASSAHEMLLQWDANFGPTSAPAALFQIWYHGHLVPQLLEKFGGEVATQVISLADERSVLELLSSSSSSSSAKSSVGELGWQAQRDLMLNDTLAAAYRDTSLIFFFRSPQDWTWGEMQTANWKHLVEPLLSRHLKTQFELEPVARGGDLTTPGMAIFNEEFDLLYGASWRMVIDVGEWDNSIFVNAPGQSGDPRSEHFDDLYQVWAEDRAVPLLYSPEAIDSEMEREIRLLPISSNLKGIEQPTQGSK
jgi:penicillin amidase